ncbi:MAG TPA: hypothetical protein VMX12_09145 [Acidimicrobiia bacterium]|nr:hypothetical protein [Acidimicrobiia bacterium]
MSTLTATNLRNLIADVTAFRTWTSTATQETARARCYIAGVDEGDYVRPFALVITEEAPTDRKVAGGAVDVHLEEGHLLVLFEDDASGDTMEDADVNFSNDVGGILSGILALAGRPGYLSISALSQREAPGRFAEDAGDDAYQALYDVEWGL